MDFLRQAYLDSVYWASDILERDFVVLDTETTDKIENGGEIIQLGIIDKDSNTLMDQLIKPKGKISEGAARVHGITAKDVAKSPTFADIYPQLQEILKDKIVVAYNAEFDRSILNNTCDLYGLEHFPNTWQCAMLEYAKYNGEWQSKFSSFRWKKLTDAASRFNIVTDGAHDACADVRMTLQVMKRMAEEYIPAIGE